MNINKAFNLSKELNRQECLVRLLEDEAKYNNLIVTSERGFSRVFILTREMRQVILEIARKDMKSIIKQIEDL